jgi:hypothetical protein
MDGKKNETKKHVYLVSPQIAHPTAQNIIRYDVLKISLRRTPHMTDWQRQVVDWFNDRAIEAETLLVDLSQDMETTIDEVIAFSEETADQVKTSFEAEIAPFLNQLLQPLLDTPLDFDFDQTIETWTVNLEHAMEDVVEPFRQTVEPTLNQHDVCMGCKHYHGQVYGGQMLVCGMHPYGPVAGQVTCADKADVDWQEPWKSWFGNGWNSSDWDDL